MSKAQRAANLSWPWDLELGHFDSESDGRSGTDDITRLNLTMPLPRQIPLLIVCALFPIINAFCEDRIGKDEVGP